jgi:hypothetical protein
MARINGGNSYELQELCELGSEVTSEANANLLCDVWEICIKADQKLG